MKLRCTLPGGNFPGIFFYQLVDKTPPPHFQIYRKCRSSNRWSTSSPPSLACSGQAFTRNTAEGLPSSSTCVLHLLHPMVTPEELWGPRQEASLQGLEMLSHLSWEAGPAAFLAEPP